jgi:hypothetical protein
VFTKSERKNDSDAGTALCHADAAVGRR